MNEPLTQDKLSYLSGEGFDEDSVISALNYLENLLIEKYGDAKVCKLIHKAFPAIYGDSE